MELWDLYDAQRQKTGRTHQRGVLLEQGDYHMVVHACVFNAAGDMLIQQRQPFKEGWPDMWDVTVGGSAIAGETAQQAVARELMEEVGIQHDFQNVQPRFTINFKVGFDDWFLVERDDIAIESLTLQPEEVQAVRWASQAEILQMIDDGSFIPYEPSLIQFVFTRKNRAGGFQG